LLIATAACFGAGAHAALACAGGPYAYAGVAGDPRVAGVGASITPTVGGFDIRAGHVAAWVGVGGQGEGPNGTDEWIQVGFSAFPDWLGNDLYFEVARPGAPPLYSRIRTGLVSGKPARVSVLEMRGSRDWWRVWVNGAPASHPIHLPGSHRRWRPVVTAESWDAGRAVCNDFGYRFERIRVALEPGGAWTPLTSAQSITNTATLLRRRSADAFVAAAGVVARQLLARG
jgi:hypothetical protein